ncbi:MAG: hypothetical protein HLUCCA11_20750 [Phormidesmis priestleyi Ana]|uniref:Uncharacterized protein n=1 Tax=Phormidesmis priestleyi Ana TaxID=1666911 RepID=A0A0P7ZIQ5_9CYAN|nr:MAG: hypothetical protein HLUCCA11_20750 [Phormidesmis priestleyi Ana]
MIEGLIKSLTKGLTKGLIVEGLLGIAWKPPFLSVN